MKPYSCNDHFKGQNAKSVQIEALMVMPIIVNLIFRVKRENE